MNRPTRITFALLSIAASVGLWYLIAMPPQGFQARISEEEFRRLRVPLPKQKDEFSHEVFLYRISGALPSDSLPFRCGLGLTEKQIQADQQALKERDAQVIAEAKRQEAQEAIL